MKTNNCHRDNAAVIRKMNIEIKRNDKLAIYLQIYKQIKEQILNGRLKSGDKILSYREIAKRFDVSIITVTKAYELLSDEKLITSSQKGCFVSENASAIAIDYNMQLTEDNLKEAIKSAKTVDISLDELHTLLNELWHE